MAEGIGLALLGLLIGASLVWSIEARDRRRVARLVRTFAYHHLGTSAPTDTVVRTADGWRHV